MSSVCKCEIQMFTSDTVNYSGLEDIFAKKHSLPVSLCNFTKCQYVYFKKTLDLSNIKTMFIFFFHREPESVREQSPGLSWSASGRDQPGGDCGPLCAQTAGNPQGHR